MKKLVLVCAAVLVVGGPIAIVATRRGESEPAGSEAEGGARIWAEGAFAENALRDGAEEGLERREAAFEVEREGP